MNADANENHAAIPMLQIQDISHYLEDNGIITGRDAASVHENSYRRQDQIEQAENVEGQTQYQTKVIGQFIQENKTKDLDRHKNEINKKESLLKKFKDAKISIRLKDNKVIHGIGLRNLVDQCDTFVTLVSWETHTSSIMENSHVFQLIQFEKDAVEHFLDLVDVKATDSSQSIVDFILNDFIIDCCYVAHYLQASEILEEIVSVIQESIDYENCTSIFVLADELQLMALRQASMKHVLERLDKIKTSELWDSIPKSLQNHILTLQNAAQSSIIGRGQTKNVIFSSSHEFLAMFHDTLTLHKERLRETKLRQEEIIKERKREGSNSMLQFGRFSKRHVQEKDVFGGSVEDAAKKILKQEERVRTLQIFYNEQKAIFAKDMQHNDQFRGSFAL